MKKQVLKFASVAVVCAALFTSCYSYTTVVGEGPKSNVEVTEWNHYLIYGLAPVGVSDAKVMAGDATDYKVTTRQSFVNGLVLAITFGIYSPSTTTVTK